MGSRDLPSRAGAASQGLRGSRRRSGRLRRRPWVCAKQGGTSRARSRLAHGARDVDSRTRAGRGGAAPGCCECGAGVPRWLHGAEQRSRRARARQHFRNTSASSTNWGHSRVACPPPCASFASVCSRSTSLRNALGPGISTRAPSPSVATPAARTSSSSGSKKGACFHQPTEDAVLLDAERAAISADLRLSSDRLDEAVYAVLARLSTSAASVTFSYSCRDTREFRETYASWLMLQAFRLQRGNAALSYHDLKDVVGRAEVGSASGPRDGALRRRRGGSGVWSAPARMAPWR